MSAIRPYGGKVLVKEITHEVSKSKMILSGSMSDDGRFVKGLVIAVGDPIPNLAGITIDPKISEGEYIMYNKLNSVKVDFEGQSYKVLPYSEIMVVLNPDQPYEVIEGNLVTGDASPLITLPRPSLIL